MRLALAYIAAAALACAAAAGPVHAAVSIQDEVWRVDVNEKGMFEIGTTHGDPQWNADDDAPLTSGFIPNGHSSFQSTAEIFEQTLGMEDNLNEHAVGQPTLVENASGDKGIRVDYGGLLGYNVSRTIWIGQYNPVTGRKDCIAVSYTLFNTAGYQKWAALHLFVDLKLRGRSEGVPILAPGGRNQLAFNESDLVTTETVFSSYEGDGNPGIPTRWLAWESTGYDEKGLRVWGGPEWVDGAGVELPDYFKVVNAFDYWSATDPFRTFSYCTTSRNRSTLSDTGIIVQWEPEGHWVDPHDAVEITYYIGLQGAEAKAPAFVSTPKATDLTVWELVLWIINMLNEGWDGGVTTLHLGDGLTVKGAAAQARGANAAGTYTLGSVPAGGAQSIVWEIQASSSAPKTYYYGAQTSFTNAPSLLAVGAVNVNTPESSVENYLHLGVSPTAFASMGNTVLSWSADPGNWGFAGVPVDVYVALTMNPAVSDRASTVGEAMGGGGQMYLFYPGMNGIYPYTGRVAAPTFSNVVFPSATGGTIGMTVGGASTIYNFAAAFIRRDNGQFVRTDLPVENSAPFYLQ